MHKRTENVTPSEEVVKGTDEVHKLTENIISNEEFDNCAEKLENMKEAVVTIRIKDSEIFESQYKGSTVWFSLDNYFLREYFCT